MASLSKTFRAVYIVNKNGRRARQPVNALAAVMGNLYWERDPVIVLRNGPRVLRAMATVAAELERAEAENANR